MRTAILLSVPVPTDMRDAVRDDRAPMPDYMALADRLDAVLMTPVTPRFFGKWKAASAARLLRSAWSGFRRRGEYEAAVCDTERAGLILALLFKLSRVRRRLVVICHGELAEPGLGRFMRLFGLQERIDALVCYGPAVRQELVDRHGTDPRRTVLLNHAADHRFWRPLPVQTERLIVSAGLTRRDYPALVKAVAGVQVTVEIAAHSPWEFRQFTAEALPDNVRLTRHDYSSLRDLYSRSLFVVVPLVETLDQSGSLVIYEAMAMGKAVVVSRTAGQEALGLVEDGVTGILVKPGDAAALSRAICSLIDKPEVAAEMGREARKRVEGGLNLDKYAEQLASLASPQRS